MRTITVKASRTYDVLIGKGLLDKAGELIEKISKAKKVMIVSDDNVFPLYGGKVSESLEKSGFEVHGFVFKSGEQSKNLKTYEELLESLYENRFNRNDAIAALGGGVVGDLSGFAAATYQRGIEYVQIPTSLLAAVDSSVGGKTAVDLRSGKNQVGCFYQPFLVICDTDTLSTLPEEQYKCGCAEIIKYAMIDSRELFEKIDRTPVKYMYEDVVAECVEIKRRIVEQDEFDRGKRMLLNFGHTLGHAAEALSGFTIPHGMAVAMGMAAVTESAVKNGTCEIETLDALSAILDKYGLPKKIPFDPSDVRKETLGDKKADRDGINMVIPQKIGECVIKNVPKSEIEKYIN